MVEFKLVINDVKNGTSYSKVTSDQESNTFKNKKIKDVVSGSNIGLKDYELEISGGSDKQGFPMRHDLEITGRKKILLTKGPGVKIRRRGMRKRKTVRGNILSLNVKQINLKVVKYGAKPLKEIFSKKEERPQKEEKETPKEEAKKKEIRKEEKQGEPEEKKEVKKS